VRHKVLIEALNLVGGTPFDGPNWCGKFVLLALQNAGLVQDWKAVDDAPGAMVCSRLKLTKNPMAGDIVKFTVHYGIFVGFTYADRYSERIRIGKLTKDTDVISVDGGSYKDVVYMSRRPSHPKTEFYSIDQILER
jgi:hypothetical protein